MINMPYDDIKAKIKEQKGLSDEEIDSKINSKLEQLSGLISKEGAAHIIANDLGVQLVPQGENLTIKDLLPGMKNAKVTGKVTRKFELREFNKNGRQGKVANLMISDETGQVRMVFWNDQTAKFNELKEGDVIQVENGYIRDNNNRKEIHINDQAKLTINPEGVEVKDVTDKRERKKLSDLKEGDDNVEVVATIVQVFDIRFFEMDPDTGKRAVEKDGKFYAGDKEVPNPGYNYVLNLFIDDGTDNVRTVLWKKQIQILLNQSDEDIIKYKDDPASFENVKNELLGEIVKIIGRTNMNTAFDRLELVANLVYKDIDPENEIKEEQKKQEAADADTSSQGQAQTSQEQKPQENTPQEQAKPESQENQQEAQPQTQQTQQPQSDSQPQQQEQSSQQQSQESKSTQKPSSDNDDDSEMVDEEDISIEDLEKL